MEPADIVSDLLQRILSRFTLPADLVADVERDVRRDWGGDRPYIAKQGELGRRLRSAREERIRAEHRRGEHVGILARRWGLSIRRIQQIVKSA
ncbi:MAG: hypothetical protein NVV68_06845 [Dokdonella sp.]|nr:hypothetical protein [Dokdonella sp.]